MNTHVHMYIYAGLNLYLLMASLSEPWYSIARMVCIHVNVYVLHTLWCDWHILYTAPWPTCVWLQNGYIAKLIRLMRLEWGEATPLNLSMRVRLERHVRWTRQNGSSCSLEFIDSQLMVSLSSTAKSFLLFLQLRWSMGFSCLHRAFLNSDLLQLS